MIAIFVAYYLVLLYHLEYAAHVARQLFAAL